jgi:hypothetical protein
MFQYFPDTQLQTIEPYGLSRDLTCHGLEAYMTGLRSREHIMHEGKLVFAQLTLRKARATSRRIGLHRARSYTSCGDSMDSHKTLANSNMVRGWRLYEEFAQSTIVIARSLYVDDLWGPT